MVRLTISILLNVGLLLGHGSAEDRNLAHRVPVSKQNQYFIPPGAAPLGKPYQIIVVPQSPSFLDYVLHTDRPKPPSAPSNNKRNFLLFLALYGLLIRPTNAPTTEVTVTTTSAHFEICRWSPWSECSAACRGARTRTRRCAGNTQIDSEICNTQTGFQADGRWYRASNCFDYFINLDRMSYVDQEAACKDRGGQLASSGMRDDSVRTEVLSSNLRVFGSAILFAPIYIGVTNQAIEDVFEWTDGYVGRPTFFPSGIPISGGGRCYSFLLSLGFTLGQTTCSSLNRAICERAAR